MRCASSSPSTSPPWRPSPPRRRVRRSDPARDPAVEAGPGPVDRGRGRAARPRAPGRAGPDRDPWRHQPRAAGADRRHRRVRQRAARRAAGQPHRRRRALPEGPADRARRRSGAGCRAAARGPARRAGRARQADPRRAAGRIAHRHRVAAPRRPARGARPRTGADRDPRQRRHPDRHGRRRQARRRGAGPGRDGPARPARRGDRGAGPDPGAAGPRAGCAGDRDPPRPRRDRGGAGRPGHPGRRTGRAHPAGDPGGGLHRTGRRAGGGRRGRGRTPGAVAPGRPGDGQRRTTAVRERTTGRPGRAGQDAGRRTAGAGMTAATSKRAGKTTTQKTSTTARQARPLGHVTFVGVGPGDPALLTLAGRDALAAADVVVVEGPEHDPFLAYCKPGVEVVDGSGADGSRALRTAARARTVVKAAKLSANVVRLLTGDPFTFSSGPEEAAACRKAGIAFNVVPGVSELTAVPSYAGIPLTIKGEREVTVLDLAESKLDFAGLSPKQTLVLLNAFDTLREVARALLDAGFDAGTPIAVTSGGTTTAQNSAVGTLDTIVADVRNTKLTGPAVITVGSVVEQREQLSWFETKPLFGWRILVPRTKDQAGPLMERLRRYGAVPEEVPTISVEPPRNPQQMHKAIRGLVEGRYEWVAFTSVNAV